MHWSAEGDMKRDSVGVRKPETFRVVPQSHLKELGK
jgi:hypothetical protein